MSSWQGNFTYMFTTFYSYTQHMKGKQNTPGYEY